MAYVKQVWTDRQVEKPLTFNSTTNADGTITLSPAPGKITQAGTLVTADRMNHIENGIGSLDSSISDLSNTVSTLSTQVDNSKLKGDFQVIEAQFAINKNGIGSATVPFPNGFNKDNCCVVSSMWKTADYDNWFQGVFNNTSGLLDTLVVLLGNNVGIQGEYGRDPSFYQGTVVYTKIILMKIS